MRCSIRPLSFFVALFISCLVGPTARAEHASCTAKLDWTCFESTVGIVGRGEDHQVVSFCSGVAIDARTVVTAGHCVESLAKPSVREIQIYMSSVIRFDQPAVAYVEKTALHLDRLYNRATSYFHHDRGLLKLASDLPHVNFPILDRATASTIGEGSTLHRIGFGQRPVSVTGVASSTGSSAATSAARLENRRTWVQTVVHTALSETLITEDHFAFPGDSGGPLFLFVPGRGIFFVGVHSTLDHRSGLVYSPRIL